MPARRVPLLFARAGAWVEPDGPRSWRERTPASSAVDAAHAVFTRADALYVLDVDGQSSGVVDLAFYQALERRRIFPWVDAGCRKVEDAMDILFAGAEAITIQRRHIDRKGLEEIGTLAEADFHIGLTVDATGVEDRTRPADILSLVETAAATGVVFYEGERADLHAAENAAAELQRNGVPVTWVGRGGSALEARALASPRFSTVVLPEPRP